MTSILCVLIFSQVSFAGGGNGSSGCSSGNVKSLDLKLTRVKDRIGTPIKIKAYTKKCINSQTDHFVDIIIPGNPLADISLKNSLRHHYLISHLDETGIPTAFIAQDAGFPIRTEDRDPRKDRTLSFNHFFANRKSAESIIGSRSDFYIIRQSEIVPGKFITSQVLKVEFPKD